MPVVGTPFERITMDLVGPLTKSVAGHQYIMVIMDYATWLTEVIPLQSMTAWTITAELMKVFA